MHDLIERSSAVNRIEAALAGAADGDGSLELVTGPAGIGKTALLTAAGELAAARGFLVLSAVGTELERGFPFGVVRQLYLRRQRERAVDAEDAIAPLFAPPDARDADLDVSFQVLDGLYWLLADLAEEAPLLLALDDAQWADEPSLRHLAYVSRRLDGVSAALLVAARSGEQPGGLLEELEAAAAARIEPAPLSPNGVAAMVERGLGVAPSQAFASACLRRTGGYPLYLAELLREARNAGIEPTDAAAADLDQLDADRLAQHVWRRIESVGDGASAVVGLVLVLGPRAAAGRIAALSDLPAARVIETVEQLAARGVLDGGERPRFVHPIVRAAVEGRLSPARLDAWHRAAARLLDEEGAEARDVAAHLLRCQPEGDVWAAERLTESARSVLGRGAPEAAAGQLRRALEERPTGQLRLALLRDLARAEEAVGDPAAALARYDEAERIAADPATRVEIAIARAQALALLDSEEAVTTLEAAFTALDGCDAELEQRIDAELIVHCFRSRNARERALRRLARYDGRIPDGPAAQAVLTAQAYGALVSEGSIEQAAGLAERALRLGRGHRGGGSAVAIWAVAAWVLVVADRADVAQELAERELPSARREGHRGEILAVESSVALAAWRQGDLPAAVSHAETGLAIGDPGPFRAWARGFKAAALLDAGDLGAVERELASVPAEHWQEEVGGAAILLYARARLRIEQGRPEEAEPDVTEMRRRSEAADQLRDFYDFWLPLAVRLACRRGDLEAAGEAAEEQVEYLRPMGSVGSVGRSLRELALTVREPAAAIATLRESEALLAPSCYRLEHALTLVELGAALRRQGERAASREPLAAGLDIAYRCGANGLVSRALQELRASGARPRRTVLTGAEALTPTEKRMAMLAAEGRSNREIARELYVTVKTVEGTLGRAYAKLGISGRGAREALPQALAPLRAGS